MEKIGFAKREKSKEDSRFTTVLLTKKGAEFKTTFEQISNKLIKTAFKGFNDGEIKTLEAMLSKIRNNLQ